MKYILFFSKIRKDVPKFVVCCNPDWRFKGYNQLFKLFRKAISVPNSFNHDQALHAVMPDLGPNQLINNLFSRLGITKFCFVCLPCCFTSQVNSFSHSGTISSTNHTFSLGRLEQAVNQYFVYILSLVTDNNPS